MPFGVKNGLPTYQKAITKTFCEYINAFTKIFLDDFIVFSDMSTQFENFKKKNFKCKMFGINLNLNKCAFMVFSRTILGFIVSQENKVMDLNKVV